MESFSVKTNKVTFKILQEFALKNGYKWTFSGDDNKKFLPNYPLLKFSDKHKMMRTTRPSPSDNTVSLEEAFERIVDDKKVKVGEYAYFHGNHYPQFVNSHWKRGIVDKVKHIKRESNLGSGYTVILENHSGGNDLNNFRRATEEEFKQYRKSTIFGFPVEKSKDDIYKFGCDDHRYTKKELIRIKHTLGEIRLRDISVNELYNQLDLLLNR